MNLCMAERYILYEHREGKKMNKQQKEILLKCSNQVRVRNSVVIANRNKQRKKAEKKE